MNVRKSILAVTVLFGASLFAQSAFAQGAAPSAPGQPGARRQRMNRPQGGNQLVQMLTALRGLNLTADQQAKVKELTDKLTTDVQALLTPEQKAELEKQMAQGPQGGAAQGGLGANLMTTLDPLNLTSDQKTQIQPIVEDFTKKMQEMRQNGGGGGNNRQAMMQAMNDLKAKIRPLLTPEQQTKFDTLQMGAGRAGRGGRRGGQAGGAGAPPPAGVNF